MPRSALRLILPLPSRSTPSAPPFECSADTAAPCALRLYGSEPRSYLTSLSPPLVPRVSVSPRRVLPNLSSMAQPLGHRDHREHPAVEYRLVDQLAARVFFVKETIERLAESERSRRLLSTRPLRVGCCPYLLDEPQGVTSL
jgi:hypothetical protein